MGVCLLSVSLFVYVWADMYSFASIFLVYTCMCFICLSIRYSCVDWHGDRYVFSMFLYTCVERGCIRGGFLPRQRRFDSIKTMLLVCVDVCNFQDNWAMCHAIFCELSVKLFRGIWWPPLGVTEVESIMYANGMASVCDRARNFTSLFAVTRSSGHQSVPR